jgi:deoxycytidine triphosphate deaminase
LILTGAKITAAARSGHIVIRPFNRNQVNPNSYNFRLDRTLLTYRTDQVLDPRRMPVTEQLEIPDDGLELAARRLYLGSTVEVLGSEYYAPTYATRSSVARLGLFISLSASLGDIGFIGQWTLQLFPTVNLTVYPGMEIGQMMWWKPHGPIELYHGKYQNSSGPTASRIRDDFV